MYFLNTLKYPFPIKKVLQRMQLLRPTISHFFTQLLILRSLMYVLIKDIEKYQIKEVKPIHKMSQRPEIPRRFGAK